MKDFLSYLIQMAQVLGIALLVITLVLMWANVMAHWGLFPS